MIKTKIAYLALIIISLIFFILYKDNLSLYFFILIIFIPILMLTILLTSKFCIKANICGENTAIKNMGAKIKIILKNKSIFPFPNCTVFIRYQNRLKSEYGYTSVSVPLNARNQQTLYINLESEYCGIMEVNITKIKIYDYIKLFSCRIKSSANFKITIMPHIHNIPSPLLENNIKTEESDNYSKYKSGDDASQIFDLKNYTPGNKINRIHWNLSAKQDELLVKCYSQPVHCSSLIVLEFYSEQIHAIKDLDTLAETTASLSDCLLSCDAAHDLLWYNKSNNTAELNNISEIEDLLFLITNLFDSGAYNDDFHALKEMDKYTHLYSKIYYITSEIKEEALSLISTAYQANITVLLINPNLKENTYIASENIRIIKIYSNSIEKNFSDIIL